MGLEALRQQLAEGKLTKEQFAAELAKLLNAGTITQEEHDAEWKDDAGTGGQGGSGGTAFTDAQMAEIQKMMQSEADKVRTKAAQEKKALEDELDEARKAKMTEEEKAKFEKEKYERDLADREAKLTAREVELHTIDKLTEAKLPMSFKSFLVSGSKEEADKNVELFAATWQAELKAAVEEKFKDNGTDPGGKGGGTNTAKKWKEMNLTEQGKMFKEDPEKARKLAAESGVKL